MNRLKFAFLGIIVSLLAIYFISSQMNLELFLQAWQRANYWFILPTMLLLLVGLVTRAIRWRLLLNNELPLLRAFSIMNVAYLVNGILPLRIGEVARVYLVSRTRKSIPIPTTTSTIILERLLDLLAVVLMVLLSLSTGNVPDEIKTVSSFFAIVSVTGFLLLIVMAAKAGKSLEIFQIVLGKIHLGERFPILETWFGQFLDGLKPLTDARQLLFAFFWTGLSWAISTFAGYVLMFAFFEEASLSATMLYIAAAAFAIALPAVPANLGTYEASILLALVAMGYPQSDTAIAFSVTVHAVNLVVHMTTGLIGFIQEGVSLSQLSQGVREMQEASKAG